MIYKTLKVGDIVVVDDKLIGIREYPVKKILGNKGITDYMVFNKRIYPNGNVYELGERDGYFYTRRIYIKTND